MNQKIKRNFVSITHKTITMSRDIIFHINMSIIYMNNSGTFVKISYNRTIQTRFTSIILMSTRIFIIRNIQTSKIVVVQKSNYILYFTQINLIHTNYILTEPDLSCHVFSIGQ